jgi:hypothetical protein
MSDVQVHARETATPITAPPADLAREALHQLADLVGMHFRLSGRSVIDARYQRNSPAARAQLIFVWCALSFGGASIAQLAELLGMDRHTAYARSYAVDARFTNVLFEETMRPVVHALNDDVVLKRRLRGSLDQHRRSNRKPRP